MEAAEREVTVVAPFLSYGPVQDLIATAQARGVRLNVLTALTSRAIAAGVLSVRALEGLLAAGADVRSIANVHAKVVLADQDACSVGSSNLTRAGLGIGALTNVELGVLLRGSYVDAVRREVERWWRAAERVDADILSTYREAGPTEYATNYGPLLKHGPKLGPAVTDDRVDVRGSAGQNLAVVPTGARLIGDLLWLKAMHGGTRDGEWWRDLTWMSTPHRFSASGEPVGRPSIGRGCRVVLYVAGTKRCPAVYEVTSDPEFVKPEATNPDAADLSRWGWRFLVEPVVACALHDAPTLTEIGVAHTSVRQASHIRLATASYDEALERIGAASSAAGRSPRRRVARSIGLTPDEALHVARIFREMRSSAWAAGQSNADWVANAELLFNRLAPHAQCHTDLDTSVGLELAPDIPEIRFYNGADSDNGGGPAGPVGLAVRTAGHPARKNYALLERLAKIDGLGEPATKNFGSNWRWRGVPGAVESSAVGEEFVRTLLDAAIRETDA